MAEYIGREALIAEYDKAHKGPAGGARKLMVEAPAADVVKVKHGRWKMQNFIIFDSEKVGYRCSECNTTWDTNTRYCPYCGAKMDGVNNDN